MDKAILTPTFSPAYNLLATVMLSITLLSSCVTQNYENDNPVVQNQANRDEMAATRISLGLGYLKMGNMAQAKLNLEKAKKFSPELVQVYTAFAHYYEVVGENELTSESYEKALSIKADDADTLNNYGVFLCRQKQVAAAEVQFLRAIAVPSYLLVAQSYENLASCYLQIDDFDKAEQYLNKAIDHSPNRTATLLQMVRLQYAKAEYGQAKRYQQKFERHTRRFTPDSLALAYKVYRKLGQRRTAKNYGTMLVKMYPQSWESKQYLLNELELIEADNLAKRYQLTQRRFDNESSGGNKSKKRIVKLSPKSKATAAATASLAAIKDTNPIVKADKAQITAGASDNISEIKPQQQSTDSTKKIAQSKAATTEQVTPIAATEANTIIASAVVVDATLSESSKEAPVNAEDDVAPNIESSDEKSTQSNAESPVEVIADSADNIESASTEVAKIDTAANADINAALTSTVLTSGEVVKPKENRTEIDSLTGTLTHVSTEPKTIQNTLPENTSAESNSTEPVPAKRDEPLPEPVAFIENEEPQDEVTEQALVQAEDDESGENALTEQDVELSSEEAVEKSISKTPDEIVAEVQTTTLETKIDTETDAVSVNNIENEEEQENTAEISTNESIEKAEPIYHQVSSGETLYAISVKYNVKIKALRKWNKMSANHKLQIKEKLYVVNPETVTNIND